MSTQFDTSNASAVCVIDKKAAAAAVGATDWATTPHHDHHQQQQLATHIAVHTPINAPRGSSCESQSFPAYSNGSPQAGFHVPANEFGSVSSPGCTTSTPYQRHIHFDQSASVIAENEPANDTPARANDEAEFDNSKVKIEVTDASYAAKLSNGDAIERNAFLFDTLSAANALKNGQNGGIASISISQLNTADCLPFYEQQQLITKTNCQGSKDETQQQFDSNNADEDSNNGNNESGYMASTSAERRTEALANGIAAPQPLRGDTPIGGSYDNSVPTTTSETGFNDTEHIHSVLDYDGEKRKSIWQISATPKKHLVKGDANPELAAELGVKQWDCDPKVNNNNNLIVNNNNNNSNMQGSNGGGQFYSLGKSGNRTFFRAPGLEAPDMSQMSAVDSRIRVCPVCSFSCKSTFHYNSHMNTHGDHQCTMCNYTSRTEGRLRKHMRESHTHAERVKAGLEEAAITSTSPDVTATNASVVSNSTIDASSGISTTMTSIVNMVNMAAAAPTTASSTVSAPVSNSAAQELLAISEKNSQTAISAGFMPSYSDALSSLSLMKDASPSKGALDQIKALTERANNPLSALNEILGISAHNENGLQNGNERDGVGPRYSIDDDDEMDADVPTSSSSAQGQSQSQPQSHQQPVVRRSGRPKIYKCKQCPYVSTTKDERWAHSKTHIPLDKQLVCTHCGFVTEYKHHLEYHMRNHKGSKPFKCSKCAYTCVNKSMLNSHMKSHTPVYQYRCKDCTYQTKYCHSLKMHLEKYRHTRMPGTVEMDSDGEEKSISEGDPDDYGNMDVNEGRNGGEDPHHEECNAISVDEHQQQTQQQQAQLPQIQQQTAHSTLNSMLLQPIVSSASLTQYSDQIQQYPSLRQLEQVNELLRAANPTTFSCRQCDYVTTSNEELLRHSVAHLFVNQQQQQQPPSLTSLYQNLAAVQQQQQTPNSEVYGGHQQQQQTLNTVLASTGSELLSGILQPDSGTKELAAQLQQEILRAQAAAQQQQQQQQQQHEEESRRQAVVAAMASLANSNLGNGTNAISNSALTSALLGHVSASATTSASLEPDNITPTHSIAFSQHQHQSHQDQSSHHATNIFTPTSHVGPIAGADNSSTIVEATSTHFHSSTTTTSSFGFGNDDDELQLVHSLSPTGSSGRRGSVGSASTSGGESTSKTCSVSPDSEGHGGSRKQRKPSKTIKVDQISAKLRNNVDPSKRHRSREREGEHRSKSNGTVLKSSSSDYGGLRTRSNSGEESNFSTLLAQLNQQNQMPHSCQHCMIAFRDRALYQIHLGYHGYDTPFKCNRCGHVSDSSLEFNLHLYQAKHD